MSEFLLDAYEIAKFIKDSKKKTPIKLYLRIYQDLYKSCLMAVVIE